MKEYTTIYNDILQEYWYGKNVHHILANGEKSRVLIGIVFIGHLGENEHLYYVASSNVWIQYISPLI